MGKSISTIACLVLLVCWVGEAADDPFAGSFVGNFEDEEYRLTLEATGNYGYEGELVIGSETRPLVARRFGDRLSGQIGIGGDSFDFSAEFSGDVLLLRDAEGEVIYFRPAP